MDGGAYYLNLWAPEPRAYSNAGTWAVDQGRNCLEGQSSVLTGTDGQSPTRFGGVYAEIPACTPPNRCQPAPMDRREPPEARSTATTSGNGFPCSA
jgi:hypothetical protein